MPSSRSVGLGLRHARRQAGLSQAMLARRMGVKRAWVSGRERGRVKVALLDFLRWCSVCEVNPEDICAYLLAIDSQGMSVEARSGSLSPAGSSRG